MNRTNAHRGRGPVLALVAAAFFSWLAFPQGARALEDLVVRIDQATAQRGYTVDASDRSFMLGIPAGALVGPAVVTVSQSDVDQFPLSAGNEFVSPIFSFSVEGQLELTRALTVRVRLVNERLGADLYQWQAASASWVAQGATLKGTVLTTTTAAFSGTFVAQSPTAPVPSIASPKAALWDDTLDAFIYSKQGTAAHPLASLTKLATALVFLEHNPGFDTQVTYEAGDSAIGSRLRVRPGETLTARDLFYSSLVGSANNATNALARTTGLSRESFVARMNELGASIGLTATSFVDPTGLDPANTSTAEEVATLAARAFRSFDVLKGTTVRQYIFRTPATGVHQITNTNDLTTSSLYLTGGKTGYLDEAGYNLVAKARSRSGGHEFIAVALGATSKGQASRDVERLLRWALDNGTRLPVAAAAQ